MRPGVEHGANCQLFAYAVLSYFGRIIPPLRSSELWADQQTTTEASSPLPLDLLLFNDTMEPYAAHVGLWVGDGEVLHLCREAGHPEVWTLADFAARDRYRCLIGLKRVVGDS